MYNSESVLENETHKLLWDFKIQTDHLISARRPDLIIINKKRGGGNCRIVDFAVPVDHRVKLKECEKRDKYLHFARELKKLWNMKVTIIPTVTGALGTVTKGLVQGLEDLEIRGRVEIILTTALLGSTRILRRVLETCCHSNTSEEPSANAGVKNSQKRTNSNNNNNTNKHLSYKKFVHNFKCSYLILIIFTHLLDREMGF